MSCPICKLTDCSCLVWGPIILAITITIFLCGRWQGFREGVESVDFDRANANLKLQQCMRIIIGDHK